MENKQKEIAKKYKHLNGLQIKCYIGRIPCKYKHIEKELSLYEKENCFGIYDEIIITINSTFFNGKFLTIFPKYINIVGIIKEFKISIDEIDLLTIIK
jgi:hypothetical protein